MITILKEMIEVKIIKNSEAEVGANSEKCKTIEYSFGDNEIDLGLATISGRYPEEGWCVNLISKELIYVLEGKGEICFENTKISFEKGDSILINNNEKYYWQTEHCKVSMTCTPAWSKEQYELIK